jgi:hypothetical protein
LYFVIFGIGGMRENTDVVILFVVYLLIGNDSDKVRGGEVKCHLPPVMRRADSKKMV